jgi:glutathione peroxidase
MKATVYGFSAKTLAGKEVSLRDYAGKVILVVNTASKCGFTPQYRGLEKLYQDYQDRGLVILGFPCNQFGQQEPGTASQITEFCELNYGVTFPVFDKVDVNGPGAHPLFNFLVDEKPGLLGSKKIKWNFTKFLVNRQGEVVRRFAPLATPAAIEPYIKQLL